MAAASACRALSGSASRQSSGPGIWLHYLPGLQALKTPVSVLLARRLKEHRSGSWALGSLGVYGACSNREEYARFAVARYFAFGALERAFAAQPLTSPLARVWWACPELHGAPRKLEYDLRAVGVDGTSSTPSPAAAAYVAKVDEAATDSLALLGHFYGHYLADLLEAPAQGRHTQLAMGLVPGTPEICRLPESVEEDRPAYLQTVSAALDNACDQLSEDQRLRAAEGVSEALTFLTDLHSERSRSLATGTALGVARVASGYLSEKLRGAAEAQSDSPMQLLLPNARRVITTHAQVS